MKNKRPLTPKQEAFVRAYLETGSGAEAYRRAYAVKTMSDNAIRVAACKLLDHPNVALMIGQEKAKVAIRHHVTLDSLTDMAFDAYNEAKAAKYADAMVKAVAQLSKMHGFDAKERDNDRMPVGDVLAMIEARRKERENEAGVVH